MTWERQAPLQAAIYVYFRLKNRAPGEIGNSILARGRRYSAAPIAASVDA